MGHEGAGAVNYTPVIGLEIRARLMTRSKLFCHCPSAHDAEPNSCCCPVCLGLPGALPVLNRRAVELALRAAVALGCRINRKSIFERKNRLRPELPKGYVITQHSSPLAYGGSLALDAPPGSRRVGISRLILEEDTGRVVRDRDTERSLLDFNLAGTPIVKMVTGPDHLTPGDAARIMLILSDLLVGLEVCHGRLEHGPLRCDADVCFPDPDLHPLAVSDALLDRARSAVDKSDGAPTRENNHA
jgi:aspartyl-tRNA(Asn)/glutamyl-tRNA(Gln) amidotransferase subunit B